MSKQQQQRHYVYGDDVQVNMLFEKFKKVWKGRKYKDLQGKGPGWSFPIECQHQIEHELGKLKHNVPSNDDDDDDDDDLPSLHTIKDDDLSHIESDPSSENNSENVEDEDEDEDEDEEEEEGEEEEEEEEGYTVDVPDEVVEFFSKYI